MQPAGRTFVVTGAGSGLGRATAAALVEAGARIVCVDIDEARARETAALIGGASEAVRADVTSEDEVALALDVAGPTLGGAVNCAGTAVAERVLGRGVSHPLDLFARVVTVNLVGTFNVVRLTAAALSDRAPGEDGERGVIVNTASVAAFDGQVGQAAYAASKGGVAALTLPVARELARIGVRCVAVAPGLFDTPMLGGLPEAARVSLAEQVPFPARLGQPDEYASLVLHVIRNRMLNGEVIRLDGALRMAPR